jgi:hypothetical protein
VRGPVEFVVFPDCWLGPPSIVVVVAQPIRHRETSSAALRRSVFRIKVDLLYDSKEDFPEQALRDGKRFSTMLQILLHSEMAEPVGSFFTLCYEPEWTSVSEPLTELDCTP